MTYDLGRKCLSEVGVSDFDGDEMNIHVPQSPEAIAEAKLLMNPAQNLVSTQAGSPCNGLVQDSIGAFFILTQTWDDGKPYMIDYETFMFIMGELYLDDFSNDFAWEYNDLMSRAAVYYPKYISKTKNGRWFFKHGYAPGKILASVVFPRRFRYKKKSPDERFKYVHVKNGIIMPNSAGFSKKEIGISIMTVAHKLWKYFTPNDAQTFIEHVQRLSYIWLVTVGFSIGFSDSILTNKTIVQLEIDNMEAKYHTLMNSPNIKDMSLSEIEGEVSKITAKTMNIGIKMSKQYANKGLKNAFNVSSMSGAKGSVLNFNQAQCLMGQQTINGGRVPNHCSRGQRTLCCVEKGDNTLSSRGFVKNNLVHGLDPIENFLHAMAGRQGLISTAIMTSITGYMQKRISRKLEDVTVMQDGSVRDAQGRIIQFLYSGDGMDTRYLVHTSTKKMFANIRDLADDINATCYSADKLICKTHKKEHFISEEIDAILSIVSIRNGVSNPVIDEATASLKELLRAELSKVTVCAKVKMGIKLLELLSQSIVQTGTAIGLIAASDIGAPTTQLTLNTFHHAGSAEHDSSGGLPKLNEFLNLTKTNQQKNPSITIYIKDVQLDGIIKAVLSDKDNVYVHRIKAVNRMFDLRYRFEHTTLATFVDGYPMYYKRDETVESSSYGLITREVYNPPWWVNEYTTLHGIELEFEWVLVLNVDLNKLYKTCTLKSVADKINACSEKWYTCIPSPLNVGQLHIFTKPCNEKVLKVFKPSNRITLKNLSYYIAKDVYIDHILSTSISGIHGITKVYPVEDPFTREWRFRAQCRKGTTYKQSMERFMEVMGLEEVDKTRTICSDVHTCVGMFGINSGERLFINETSSVLNNGGGNVDLKHLILLGNKVSHSGIMTPMTRNGMKNKGQPISSILFECPIVNAVSSCFKTEIDPAKSFASSVMMGKPSELIGTGSAIITNPTNSRKPKMVYDLPKNIQFVKV